MPGDLGDHGIAHQRQTCPGRRGLVTKGDQAPAAAFGPIVEPLRPTLERLTPGTATDARLLGGPRRGVMAS